MNNSFQFKKVTADEQIQEVADLADLIWRDHFTPIIGIQQVEYMLHKFQSFEALKTQLQDGYVYYQMYHNHVFCGYCGIHPENNKLFLSKLYIKKECRGHHLATKAFRFLIELCKERKLTSMWLTCNKHNNNTLAVYKHLGFEIIDTQEANIGNGYIMDDYIMEYTL